MYFYKYIEHCSGRELKYLERVLGILEVSGEKLGSELGFADRGRITLGGGIACPKDWGVGAIEHALIGGWSMW